MPPRISQAIFPRLHRSPAPAARAEGDLDLDARQDDLLRQLDELNSRIEAVIREFAPGCSRANISSDAARGSLEGDEPLAA